MVKIDASECSDHFALMQFVWPVAVIFPPFFQFSHSFLLLLHSELLLLCPIILVDMAVNLN